MAKQLLYSHQPRQLSMCEESRSYMQLLCYLVDTPGIGFPGGIVQAVALHEKTDLILQYICSKYVSHMICDTMCNTFAALVNVIFAHIYPMISSGIVPIHDIFDL